MVVSQYGVGSYYTGVDSYANLPIRPSMTTGSAEHGVLHRYHTASEEEWKPKPKKSVALSALVLLSFLFFLNMLQNGVEDHLDQKHHHSHHPRCPYFQNCTYPFQYRYPYQYQQYPWPIWQVSGRTDLKPQQRPQAPQQDEEIVYDESQDDVSEDSMSEEEANEEESTAEAPIERFIPDYKTRINSKLAPIPTGSVGENGVFMEKLAPIVDTNKKHV